MTEQMDMEDIFIQMVNIISATGKMIMLTVKVYCAMQMDLHLMESGLMIYRKDMEQNNGQMELFLWVST